MTRYKSMVRAAAVLCVLMAVASGAYGESVTGSARLGAGVALPADSVFEAVLQDVSRADAPAVEVGRFRSEGAGGPDFDFEIPYNPDLIEPGHVYTVRATVRVGDQLWYTTDAAYPVITRDAPLHVDLSLVGTGPATAGNGNAAGSDELVQVDIEAAAENGAAEQAASPDPVAETADAGGDDPGDGDDDGEAVPTIRGMISLAGGETYFLDCQTQERSPVLAEGDFEALQHAYLAAGREPGLPLMATFEGAFVGEDDGGGSGGRAVRVDRFVGIWPEETCEQTETAVTLTNTFWRITEIAGVEVKQAEGLREPHMILPVEEPRFTATVGCNQIIGSYTLEGDSLRFGHAAATMMACPEPVAELERKLAMVLGETAGWRIDGDTLELLDASGNMVARFVAVILN